MMIRILNSKLLLKRIAVPLAFDVNELKYHS
jgi:hypothetical protein